MNFLKKTFMLSILVLSGFLVGLLLSEALVRFVAPQRLAFAIDLYEPHPDLVFKLLPKVSVVDSQFEYSVPIVTNSLGFRDEEIGSKQEGTYRILGVGDSFSFANGVTLEETYFKQLEQCLNTGTGHAVEIINGAVPAYSLIQEKRFVKEYSEKLDIDAVLVGFYVGNDFVDSMELSDEHGNPLIEVRNHNLYSSKERDREENFVRRVTAPMRTFLTTHSHLYTFLRNRFSELLSRIGLRAPIPPPEFLEKEYSTHMKKAWEVTKDIFMELSEYTRASGIDLYVVALPTIYQGHRDLWDQYVEINGLDPSRYDLEKTHGPLSEFSEQQGIEFIDVLPKMQRVGNDELLFYPVDSHMNPVGHRVVADSLCAYFAPKFDLID